MIFIQKKLNMAILDTYTKLFPKTGRISKGNDKTPIEGDGGKDLSKNEALLKKSRRGELGQGSGGYTPTKNYSSTNPK
jgi:hypothetical protein